MNFLHDISWPQFLTLLTIAFVIYYAAAIGVLIKAWWNNAKTATGKRVVWQPKMEEIQSIISEPAIGSTLEQQDITPVEPSPTDPESDAEIIRFGNDLEKLIEEHRSHSERTAILFSLSHMLANHELLHQEPMRSPLINVMRKRFRDECNIDMETADIEEIWNNAVPAHENDHTVVR